MLPLMAAMLALAALSSGRFAGAAEEAPAPTPDPAAVPAPAVPAPAPVPALVRVSSSFEAKHASAVLRQVAKLFDAGFVRRDAERVAAEIDALPAEQSRVWNFSAVQKGRSYVLRVRARLDEFGDVDVDFFSAPEIAPAVRSAVDHYLNARGL
ncbi:MAG: hypothetical protein ACLQFT_16890 [Steroidobacteraceae bacterium]|jgi:hypothetical protein|nr:hypothetical protein [Steroidobacteraceae bacterium]